MKVTALVQARMGSTRLPGKMLRLLHGRPIIDWVVERVRRSGLLDALVIALPGGGRDDALAEHLRARGADVFRGPEEDVLERFYLAAAQVRATHVVRVCADNPLVWGGEIDALIRFYRSGDREYVYNHIPCGNAYPDGFGAEMLSFDLLEELRCRAALPEHREHCFSYIWAHPSRYRMGTFDPADPALRRPDLRFDVDTAEDLERLQALPLRPDMEPVEIVRLCPKSAARA